MRVFCFLTLERVLIFASMLNYIILDGGTRDAGADLQRINSTKPQYRLEEL